MSDLTDTIADGPLASEGYTFTYGVTVTDNAAVASDSVSYKLTPGGTIADTARATDSWSYGSVSFKVVVNDEGAQASETWQVAHVASISDSAVASASFKPSFLPKIVQSAKASDLYTTSFGYHLSRSESARASEAWSYINAVSVGDSASASDLITIQYTAGVQIADSAIASDLLVPVRGATVSLVEKALASDALLPSFAYQVTMNEPGFAALFMDLSGSITAWAINTRTNAITEYKNFSFNSAVSMGRKYVVANENGLFELNGATDENDTNVIANIAGGYFRANGNKYAGLKGVYLGMGGQGPGSASGSWMLTLTLGDGRDYVYQSQSNPSLMTSKINIGKGLRASYMAWALSNADGQDFDLDNIEFIPMMSGRRVG